jgi:hypothetical protein
LEYLLTELIDSPLRGTALDTASVQTSPELSSKESSTSGDGKPVAMRPIETPEQKRQRNKLAAEKYRRKKKEKEKNQSCMLSALQYENYT